MPKRSVLISVLITAVLLMALACKGGPEAIDEEGTPAPRWPRTLENAGYEILVYEPQLDAWTRFEKLEVRSAVVLEQGGAEHPIVGGIVWTADTETDFTERTVVARNIAVSEATFAGLDAGRTEELRATVERAFPKQSAPIPLDLVLAHLERKGAGVHPVDVNDKPPPIFVSQEPAILLQFMGEPRFEQVAETTLMIAVNASWDVFFSAMESAYYLRLDDAWLTAPDPLAGPWRPADELPFVLQQLPGLDGWADLASAIPGRVLEASPRVFIAKQPAELIVLEGKPQFTSIPGTALMVVSNTRSKLFFDSADNGYYFLAAGRWFRSAGLDGPWQPATTELPEDFQRIPEDHESADVLASVPGTRDAEEATLAASIPRKAEVQRNAATLDVTYDGEPQTVLIENTTVYYVVNTPYDVFLVDGRYYACHEGIWFESSGSRGPWLVADTIPAAIYSIPPGSPKYNVTYVRIYDSTPDYVVVGYTSGYNGMYVAQGVVMLGMGIWLWDDDWDDQWDQYYYHYPPRYYGYGGGAWYDPYTGNYRREAHAYGPYGSAHGAAAWDPNTGAWARGASVSGYYGSRGVAEGYNPRTDTYAATRQGSDLYGSWGQSVVSRGDDWARTARYSDASGTRRAFETSQGTVGVTKRGAGGTAGVVRKDGDLYLGKDGKVYKRNEGGGWQKNEGGGNWSDVQRPEGDRASAGQSAGDGTAAASARDRTAGAQREAAPSRDATRRAGADGRQAGQQDRANRAGTGRSGDAAGTRKRPYANQMPSRDSDAPRTTPNRPDSRADRPTPRSNDRATQNRRPQQRSTQPRLNPNTSRDQVMRGLDRDAQARQRGNSQTQRRSNRSSSSGSRRGGRRGR